jgi:hypothetical protein
MKLAAKSSAAFLLCLFATVAVSGCSLDEPVLVGSTISPNGIWVAESFGYNDCCKGGFVSIHKTSERSFPSEAPIVSAETGAGTFMIWQDDDHLSLVRASNSSPLTGPNEYRGITILYSQYQVRRNDKNAFDDANSHVTINIPKEKVSARIVEKATKTGKRCSFSLSAIDGALYDKVGVTIEANVFSCNRAKICAGISSNFWVGKRTDGRHNVTLTWATVSDFPLGARYPDGNRNSSVRGGGFAGTDEVDLVKYMDQETLEIKYALNFFDSVISYRVETERVRDSIDAFKTCIGDGDFNWLEDGKVEPAAQSP